MALEVGTNSYISVEDAGEYFADRLDADAWEAADEDRQAKALVTATRDIDRRGYIGRKLDLEQPLQFPRALLSSAGWLGDDEVPECVKDATCEQALFLLSLTAYERDRRRQQTLGVIGGSLGSANEYSSDTIVRHSRRQSTLCPEARELLRDWRAGSVGIT